MKKLIETATSYALAVLSGLFFVSGIAVLSGGRK